VAGSNGVPSRAAYFRVVRNASASALQASGAVLSRLMLLMPRPAMRTRYRRSGRAHRKVVPRGPLTPGRTTFRLVPFGTSGLIAHDGKGREFVGIENHGAAAPLHDDLSELRKSSNDQTA
jgi:hypothetical protein